VLDGTVMACGALQDDFVKPAGSWPTNIKPNGRRKVPQNRISDQNWTGCVARNIVRAGR